MGWGGRVVERKDQAAVKRKDTTGRGERRLGKSGGYYWSPKGGSRALRLRLRASLRQQGRRAESIDGRCLGLWWASFPLRSPRTKQGLIRKRTAPLRRRLFGRFADGRWLSRACSRGCDRRALSLGRFADGRWFSRACSRGCDRRALSLGRFADGRWFSRACSRGCDRRALSL